jgi:hypothetical protein
MKKLLSTGLFLFWFLSGWLPAFCQSPFDCEEELFSKKDRKTRLFGYVNAIGEYRIPPTFLSAKPFIGRFAIVQQGKLFGVINCEGVLVVPAEYEEIASFSNGKGWVKKGGLWGLVEGKGRLLIQPLYEEVKEINVQSGTVTWVKKKGMWGLISKENGRFSVEAQYDDVSNLSDSAGIGRKNGVQDLVYYGDGRIIISGMKQVFKLGKNLMGYQHAEGKFGAFNSLAYILIRPEFEEVSLLGDLVLVKKEGLYGLRTSRGPVVLECLYEMISPFNDGFAAVKINQKWQLVNHSGLVVGPKGEFASAKTFPGGSALIETTPGMNGIYEFKSKKWLLEPVEKRIRISGTQKWLEIKESPGIRIFDFSQKTFWKSDFDSVSIQDMGLGIRAFQNGKTCLTSLPNLTPGKWYEKLLPSVSGYFFCIDGGKTGLLSEAGKEIIGPEYDSIEAFSGNRDILFTLKKDGKWGLAEQNGKSLILPTFISLIPSAQRVHLAKNEKGWGLISADGKLPFEARYDSFQVQKKDKDLADFPLVAFKKGKSRLINQKGEELGEAEKTNWKYLGENAWKKGKPNEYELVNSQGQIQGNLKAEEILGFNEGNGPAKIAGLWGFMNLFGKMVIPAKFEEVLPFQSGIAYAKENGKWGVLKKNGTWLVKPIGTGVSVDENGKRKLILP